MKGTDRDTDRTGHVKNRNLWVMIKGGIIGGTMLVPGVSGGSMAMILGIYDDLIRAVGSFMKHKRESFILLLLVAAGGSIGMFIFSRPILYLIENFNMLTMYFFMGTVIGGIPFIFKQARPQKMSLRSFLYIAFGIGAVLLISAIPADDAGAFTQGGITGMALLMLAGFAAAIALVLPGISVSYLLLIMGLYEAVVDSISQVYMPFLLPLGAGLLLGIAMTTRLLEKVMDMFPHATYLTILGFVLGSLAEVFPGIPGGTDIIGSIVTLCAGILVIFFIFQKGK